VRDDFAAATVAALTAFKSIPDQKAVVSRLARFSIGLPANGVAVL
jgi:hypothetical protein